MTFKIIYTTCALAAIAGGAHLQASSAGEDFSSAIATLQSDAGMMKKTSTAHDILSSKSASVETKEQVFAILHQLALYEKSEDEFLERFAVHERYLQPSMTQDKVDLQENQDTLNQIASADVFLEFALHEDPRKHDVLAKLYQIVGIKKINSRNPYLQAYAAQKFLDYADAGDARIESALHQCHFVLINPDIYRVSLLSLRAAEAVLKHASLDDVRREDAYSVAKRYSMESSASYQAREILKKYPEMTAK